MEGRVWNEIYANMRNRGRDRAHKSDRRGYRVAKGKSS